MYRLCVNSVKPGGVGPLGAGSCLSPRLWPWPAACLCPTCRGQGSHWSPSAHGVCRALPSCLSPSLSWSSVCSNVELGCLLSYDGVLRTVHTFWVTASVGSVLGAFSLTVFPLTFPAYRQPGSWQGLLPPRSEWRGQ